MFGMLAIVGSVGVLAIAEVCVLNFICGKTGVLATAASVTYLRCGQKRRRASCAQGQDVTGQECGPLKSLEAGEDGLQVNVLFSQVAQSDLRGAHKLVEGIDAPRHFFCHGYDNTAHVLVVCKNDGVVSDLLCADALKARDFLFKGVDAHSESFDFLLSGCSELLGLQCADSGGLCGLAVEEEGGVATCFVLLLLHLLHLILELCRLRSQMLEGGRGRDHAGACWCLLFGWKKGG